MSIHLNISKDDSKIQLEKIEPKLNISGQEATMSLEKSKGNFKIKQKSDKLEIDSYNAFKQLNGYNLQDLMIKNKNEAKEKTSQAVSQYVRDGESMMKIEDGGKPIINIAKNHSSVVGKTELNVQNFPEEPIEISVDKGYVEIESEPDKIDVKVNKNLKIDVQPGGVYTKIDGIPKINIEVVGELLDSKV